MSLDAEEPLLNGVESKADSAYRTLRHRLIMHDIAPGEAINEAALSEELQLGRTPIREALKRLESDHLVVFYPRRGTFASHIDITELAAIAQMREVLEPLAARRAAELQGGQQRERIQETLAVVDGLNPRGDQRILLEHDLDVHRLIYRAIDNRHLAETLERLDDLATRIWRYVGERIPDMTDNIREHSEILHAILQGNADRAAELATDHVRRFEATVRSAL